MKRFLSFLYIHSYEEVFTDTKEDKSSVKIKVPEENKK